MRRTRYQAGTVQLNEQQGVWKFRWWDRSGEKPVRRSKIVGTLKQYPTHAKALRAAEPARTRANNRATDEPMGKTIQVVADRYIAEEIPDRFATRKAYLCNLRNHILPRWGKHEVMNIQPAEVEAWLSGLSFAPKSKVHLRNLLRILVDSAMRRGWIQIGRNPIELVRVKGATKRKRRRRVLSLQEFYRLLEQITHEPIRTMVVLAMCLGLRSSELFALRWCDFDWSALTLHVRRSIVDGRVDDVKTIYSEAPVPLDPAVAELVFEWKRKTQFAADDDWVFASPFMDGRLPYFGRGIQQRHLVPAAERVGIPPIGWHTFRHTYRSMLGNTNAPLDVQRDLMRHSSIVTTIDTYGDTVPETVRSVNSQVVKLVLNGPLLDPKRL